MSQAKTFGSAGFFVGTSIAAGLLNYLFQVVASRNLSPELFANLNGWFAEVSMLFLLGGVLQYGANFAPAPRKVLRAMIAFIVGLLALLTWLWWQQSEVLSLNRAIIILVVSYLSGWLMGQTQIRLAFVVISLANLFLAMTKLGSTWLPVGTPDSLDRYALALYLAFLPPLLLYCAYLWFAPETKASKDTPLWAPVIVLSITTAVIPQFDLVVMNNSLDPAAFSEFNHASLFYRAIFYLLFILAQWLLPRQVRRDDPGLIGGFGFLVFSTLAISVGLTVAAPWISTMLLKWESAPSLWLIFLSCVHMSCLALLLLAIQKACAQNRWRAGAFALAILAVEGGVQWLLRGDAITYLVLVIFVQSTLLYFARRQDYI